MKDFIQITQLIKNMGIRYFIFRVLFEVRKRSGMLKISFPTRSKTEEYLSARSWRKEFRPFFFDFIEQINTKIVGNEKLAKKAANIRSGKLTFFSGIEYDLGLTYDWVTNPDTGFKYCNKKHWSVISDFNESQGDIKFVWEKSRFSWLYTLIRDDHNNNNDHSTFVFDEMIDWIEKNPVNCGPNWKCSQEISLRVLNWIFALYYYREKLINKEEKWQRIVNSINFQMIHVYRNINFSKIAVRNNHAITESLALYVVGTLFPFYKASSKWKRFGKIWFEKEILYQVFEDGTFLQFSMNYHRVLIQLLTWAIGISEVNKDPFSDQVKERAYKALYFARQCQDDFSGYLPNYGANDGALFFPLNDSDFRDYRPQIDALHRMLTGKSAYEMQGSWNEDSNWLALKFGKGIGFDPIAKRMGIVEFPVGGYYLFRQKECFTFIRCGSHNNRPSQADNLHIDVWYKGNNILVDAGSFKYNASSKDLKYFMGSSSHNTVMLGDYDQMTRGPRFIWYNWTKVTLVNTYENDNFYFFRGQVEAFRELSEDIIIERIVRISKLDPKWTVVDKVLNYDGQERMLQNWHINEVPGLNVKIVPKNLNSRLVREKCGWYSSYYGVKARNRWLVLSSKQYKIQADIIIS